MSEFNADEFQKKLKKKVAKKAKKYGNVQINGGKSGAFYFLGFIGAAIYFVSRATGFWDGTLGFLKAIVWPVFLVYQAFVSLLG